MKTETRTSGGIGGQVRARQEGGGCGDPGYAGTTSNDRLFCDLHGQQQPASTGCRDEIIARTKEAGIKLRHREDGEGSRWVLLDYGDVVVHIFQQAEREFYALERLWGDAPKLAVSP